MEFTKELIEKAKACKTAEELLSLAKENEIELTKEDAEAILGELSEDELSDEELDNVAGGAEGCKPFNGYKREYWKNKEDVQFLFKEGDIVQAMAWFCVHHTATCKVVSRKISEDIDYGYYEEYWLEKESGAAPFIRGWRTRDKIEK